MTVSNIISQLTGGKIDRRRVSYQLSCQKGSTIGLVSTLAKQRHNTTLRSSHMNSTQLFFYDIISTNLLLVTDILNKNCVKKLTRRQKLLLITHEPSSNLKGSSYAANFVDQCQYRHINFLSGVSHLFMTICIYGTLKYLSFLRKTTMRVKTFKARVYEGRNTSSEVRPCHDIADNHV